jgi:hypothetical protein
MGLILMTCGKTTPETWEKRYNSASSSQAGMFKRFSNWYDSLYAVVGVTPTPWRSKMYVPILARQTWALISKFLTLKPGFEVRVVDDSYDDDEIEMKAEKAQKKLEYDYNNPYLDESIRDKLFCSLLDGVVTGTGMAKVTWCTKDKVTYKRKAKADGTWDLSQEEKTTRKTGYNDLEPVNIFNVFVSPSATNLYSAPWIIIKEYKTKEELKATGVYKNLDQLSGDTSYDDEMQTYNSSRNRLMGANDKQDGTVGMVKLFECYEGNTITTFAEATDASKTTSWVELRVQKDTYWHGKYPLVKFHVKNRPYQFWGEGLFETTYRLQAGYNDVFNHIMDQWNLSENSMLIAPERANVNDYVIEPGGTITYRGDIAPTQFKHAAPDFNGVQVLLQLMDSAVEGVTISNYASGIPNSAADKTKGTATGILHLQEAAGDLVSFMKTNFTQTITQIGRMWLSNNQQFMAESISVTVNNKGKSQPMEITPEDMQGDMDLLVDDASMEPASKDEQRAAHIAFVQQLMGIKQAADVQSQGMGTAPMPLDFTELAEDLSEKFGIKNFTSILLPEDQVQQAQQTMQQNMQAQAQAGQKPTQQPKAPSESINYKDVPEDVKRQLEAQAGLQPSTGVSPTGTDQMAKAQQAEQSQAQGEHQMAMTEADHQLRQQTQSDTVESQKQSLFAKMRGGNKQ